MSSRYMMRRFNNGQDVGSYAVISFEITGQTELGRESILFETEIHYIDEGEGDPVLLVHGIGQSLFTWRNNFEYLVRSGYRVIALDLAGCGYSGSPNIYYTAEEYALVIDAFLDALKIRRTHIAACTTGCLSAVCFAADNPQRVGKLILISPGAPNIKYPLEMKLLATKLGGALFRLIIRETWVKRMLQSMYFDGSNLTNEVVKGYFEPLKNKDVRNTFTRCMAHINDEYALSRTKDIQNETLIFSGSGDKLHDESIVKKYTLIHGARHTRLRNTAHLLHEEKPARINEELVKFLGDCNIKREQGRYRLRNMQ